jgi:predicted amidophosphoribosyltransferase
MLTAPGKHLAQLHKIDRIIPVPLHPKRLRQRGFNQASLLARRLGSALRISVDYASLKRFLLLDDVLTTGETVNQCVRVLKRDGGAKEVVVLTVARTVAM